MIRVLVADDHAIFRQGLIELISGEEGLEIAGTARDGQEAIDLTESLRPDVLILDISMPVVDGYEVFRRIRKQGIGVKVVVLSMHKDSGSIRRALDLGVDGYILKEDAFDELARAIRTVSEGGRFLTPSVRAVANRAAGEPERDLLTARERQVVTLIAAGKSTREIGEALHIGVKTVETHRQHIMDKLGFRKTAQIAVYAMKEGLVE
jgi:DNA-binding NarL/FixJ family response regulator